MTISTPPSPTSNSTKSAWLSGCITIFAILFAILGVRNLFFGSAMAYIFFAARMLSSAKNILLLVVACNCLIYFVLAFPIKKQHWLITLALLAVVWFFLPLATRFLINMTTARLHIDGYAMSPTLQNGDYVIADREAYQQDSPQRGDVIVFTFSQADLVKRVIGLPGEKVTVNNGRVMIDGVSLDEPYIAQAPLYEGEWMVPEDHLFVLGDNRNDSRDSHQFGSVPIEDIFAKVVWIYSPLEHFGKVDFNFAP